MAAKGSQWKGGRPSAPKEQEHRPELALQAVRLPGKPANRNAGKPAPVETAMNGKRSRKQKTDTPEGDAAKPKRGKRSAEDTPETAKRAGKRRKGKPAEGSEKPNGRKPPKNDARGGDTGGKKDPGKGKKRSSREEKSKDKDGEPFKPSVTFGDITAAVAGATERAAQFASGQVQNGAAFVTGG